jgi:hypothetical protein
MTTATSKRNALFAYAACIAVLASLMGVVLFGGNAVTPMQSAVANPPVSAIAER